MKRTKTSSLPDGPVRNPLSKTSRFNFSPLSGIPVGSWEKSSLTRWQGEEGQLARLSFEARPTILWLQDEFAHATQEMEALVPRCFSFFLPEKSKVMGFHKFAGASGQGFLRLSPVKPDYEFGMKSISFTANGCFFLRKGSSMLAD